MKYLILSLIISVIVGCENYCNDGDYIWYDTETNKTSCVNDCEAFDTKSNKKSDEWKCQYECVYGLVELNGQTVENNTFVLCENYDSYCVIEEITTNVGITKMSRCSQHDEVISK